MGLLFIFLKGKTNLNPPQYDGYMPLYVLLMRVMIGSIYEDFVLLG